MYQALMCVETPPLLCPTMQRSYENQRALVTVIHKKSMEFTFWRSTCIDLCHSEV